MDEGDKNLLEIIKKLPKDKTKLSSRKTGGILNISKSGVCDFWNYKEKTNNKRKNHKQRTRTLKLDNNSFEKGKIILLYVQTIKTKSMTWII